jgi:hypothetical protein
MTDAEVTVVLSASPIGASGILTIVAPLPNAEAGDSPYKLVADTTANTLSPSWRLKGELCRVNSGIVHWAAETIFVFRPLQVVNVS